MKHEALKELYVDELKDIYNAEHQLVKALPKMAKASTSEQLRTGFEEHFEQTRDHVQRLEQIFKELGEKPTGKKCKGMEGLVAEGQEMMEEDFDDDVMDAALISAAQRVEHYEIAAYGTVRTYAELLGEENAVKLLEQTLEEEKETNQKLSDLASDINVKAMGESSEEDSAEEEETPSPRKKTRAARA
jgi:ferritin-like metal-binding protein YciE